MKTLITATAPIDQMPFHLTFTLPDSLVGDVTLTLLLTVAFSRVAMDFLRARRNIFFNPELSVWHEVPFRGKVPTNQLNAKKNKMVFQPLDINSRNAQSVQMI